MKKMITCFGVFILVTACGNQGGLQVPASISPTESNSSGKSNVSREQNPVSGSISPSAAANMNTAQSQPAKPERKLPDGNLSKLRASLKDLVLQADKGIDLAKKMSAKNLSSVKLQPITLEQCQQIEKEIAANYRLSITNLSYNGGASHSTLCQHRTPMYGRDPAVNQVNVRIEEGDFVSSNQFGLPIEKVIVVTRLETELFRSQKSYTMLDKNNKIVEETTYQFWKVLDPTFNSLGELQSVYVTSFDASGSAYVSWTGANSKIKRKVYSYTPANGQMLNIFEATHSTRDDSAKPNKLKTTRNYEFVSFVSWDQFDLLPTFVDFMSGFYTYGGHVYDKPRDRDGFETVTVDNVEVCAEGISFHEKSDAIEVTSYLQGKNKAFDCFNKW